jgi:hypothetical protein
MYNKLRLLEEKIRFKSERWTWERDPASWRTFHPIEPPANDIVVTFLIPIFQKSRAPNWNKVCELLNRTLKALERQSDPRWRAIICSQDKPDGLVENTRVQFMPYTISHNGKNDKDPKTRHVARTLARTERRDNYIFLLDGDDIPNPRLVEYILNDNNGIGYALTRGYSLDLARREVYLHNPEVGYLFTKMCGSSHTVRFDTRQGSAQLLHVALSGMHRDTRKNMRCRLAMELDEIPFPAMLYIFNHGTSDQDLKRQKNRKIDLVPLPRDETHRVLMQFEETLVQLI